MIIPFTIITPEEEMYKLNINNHIIDRGSLICIHISDIHFGIIDPQYQYNILKEQFITKAYDVDFDVISINGDLFDHKFMSNSDAVLYASLFISDVVNLCKVKNATLVIIEGTRYHDAGQLKLFYHYLDNPEIDIRIVETTRFEYIKGAKVLCMPEEYGKGEDYYNKFLLYSGSYDLVFMHGTIKGAIYQDTHIGLESEKSPTFVIEDFVNCRGCIISGHVHISGCFNGYFYYCGSPYRWQFGEEQEKGFLVTLHNLNTGAHYVHFEKIQSHKYTTINIDDLLNSNPDDIIKYVNNIKESQGIDYIRLEILRDPTEANTATIDLIKKYFKLNNTVSIKNKVDKNKQNIETSEFLEKNKEYDFILDKSLSSEDILVRYINHNKGYLYITTEELKEILLEDI